MDVDKFDMLLAMLRSMEKHEDENVVRSALDVIESIESDLTMEQKSEVMKEMLHMKLNDVKKHDDELFERENGYISNDDGYF